MFTPEGALRFIALYLAHFLRGYRTALPEHVTYQNTVAANHKARAITLLELAATVDRRTWWETMTPMVDSFNAAWAKALETRSDRLTLWGWERRYHDAAHVVMVREALHACGISTEHVPVGILERIVRRANQPAEVAA